MHARALTAGHTREGWEIFHEVISKVNPKIYMEIAGAVEKKKYLRLRGSPLKRFKIEKK